MNVPLLNIYFRPYKRLFTRRLANVKTALSGFTNLPAKPAWTKFIRYCLIFGLSIYSIPSNASYLILKDDRGKTLSLQRPAQRIITLAPHVAELVFAAGAGNRLIAVSSFSDYPDAAKKLPLIGNYSRIDIERVMKYKPDLIIAWQSGNHVGDIEKLEKLGFAVYVTEPRRLEDIPRHIRVIGNIAGSSSQAELTAKQFESELSQLKKTTHALRPVSIFYEIWHRPLMTVNSQHMINDVIQLCGGANMFGHARSLTPTVSIENILHGNPEVIITGARGNQSVLEWRRYPQLSAVKNHFVFVIPPDLLQRQTPRLLQGAKLMCDKLQQVRLAVSKK